jgi:hypothetical protein
VSHVVQWVTASPLWDDAVNESTNPAAATREQQMREPALLQFESDSFMEELAHLLETKPETLKAKRAMAKTYRLKTPGEPEPTLDHLKLYQAVHGHFYLVAATLVCRLPGLPEHEVSSTLGETVRFVLRRLADGSEWAWIVGPDPAKPLGWKEIATGDRDTLVAEEQQLPMFPMAFKTDERKRKLYVGLVPTSSAEAFKAAGKFSPLPASGGGDPGKDSRKEELDRIVKRPMEGLSDPLLSKPELEEQKLDASRFVLLDLAEFLQAHAKPVWAAVHDGSSVTDADDVALVNQLKANFPDMGNTSKTWAQALKTAWDKKRELMGEEHAPATPSLMVNLQNSSLSAAELTTLVGNVLEPLSSLPKPPPVAGVTSAGAGGATPDPTVPKLQPDTQDSAVRYAVRCVYIRPQCEPLDHAKLVSSPSEDFAIAPFFDYDAPARSIQITMPLDTSIAGLRKHRKNVNILIAKQLREQMTRVADLKKATEGDFADAQSFDLGVMCSFSIPIISICALIVLSIFIGLLNIVFWWMPFLKICFPIGLEAKKA